MAARIFNDLNITSIEHWSELWKYRKCWSHPHSIVAYGAFAWVCPLAPATPPARAAAGLRPRRAAGRVLLSSRPAYY